MKYADLDYISYKKRVIFEGMDRERYSEIVDVKEQIVDIVDNGISISGVDITTDNFTEYKYYLEQYFRSGDFCPINLNSQFTFVYGVYECLSQSERCPYFFMQGVKKIIVETVELGGF